MSIIFTSAYKLKPVALLGLIVTLALTTCAAPQRTQSRKPKYTPPADSLLTQGLKISLDSMQVLEQAPLLDSELQIVYVGRIWRERFLSDYKFHSIEEYDYDILRDFPRNTVFDVVLDLPDSSRLALAETVSEKLTQTKQQGFYRCFLPLTKLQMLILNGINVHAAAVFAKRNN